MVKKLHLKNIKSRGKRHSRKINKSSEKSKIYKESKVKKIKENIENQERISEKEIKQAEEIIKKLKQEIAKIVVGQEKVVNGLISALICNGHVLLEGVPGIAKTLVIKALGLASGCEVKRIQFTVDLLPTDIIGITSYTPNKGFETIKGPIFANFIIADEINRSPPKTQSALIEAMQEKQVTIGKQRFFLPKPFFVMATKNPLESAGVYTLPEAQLDRFLFKLIMEYPEKKDELEIMEENVSLKSFEDFNIKAVITPKDIINLQKMVHKIYLSQKIKDYIIAIVEKTRDKNFKNAEYIGYGASPRASIALFIASKARAMSLGRTFVLPEDVKIVVFDILRHRLILNYKATVRGITPEQMIQSILEDISL